MEDLKNKQQRAAEQISNKRKEIKYETREYVIEYLVQKFVDEEFYVDPDYQRNFIWDDKNKCYFIESILMGLPIPYMFFADTGDGRIEIVDGAQRTQTLVQFMQNDLLLSELLVLSDSNGLRFEDLDIAVQRRFKNTNIRVVFLEEETDHKSKQEIFRRINTGGDKLKPAEIRRGSLSGTFHDFLSECAKNELFNKLAPRTKRVEDRYEGYELLARFFAYLNNYDDFPGYDGRVQQYIDEYVKTMNATFNSASGEIFKNDFQTMLEFANASLKDLGFRKNLKAKSTPRARFEALSVGIALALREKNDIDPAKLSWILNEDDSEDFIQLTKSDAANNKSRLIARIKYVKDSLLGD